MNTRGLNWKTSVRLFLQYLGVHAFMTLKSAAITAAILATLALVYWSRRPVDGKILDSILILIVAALYVMHCGNAKFLRFADFRWCKAATTKNTSLTIEFASRDRDARVRAEAAKRLTDQKLLEDIAQNDENRPVRAAAASALASPDRLLDLVAASNDIQMWRLCFPELIGALQADAAFRQRVRDAVQSSPFAGELLRQPTCKQCHGWVETQIREVRDWPQEEPELPRGQKAEPDVIRYELYCCHRCMEEYKYTRRFPFSDFLTEANTEPESR